MTHNQQNKSTPVFKAGSNDQQNLYHKMIDEVQDYAIIFLDIDGIIQNWNKGAEKIKQYTEAEAVGMNFRMFYLPSDQESKLPERLLAEATNIGHAAHEGWRLRKDKTRFWGSIILTAIHDEQGRVTGFTKVTRDLTEKKYAEDQLRIFSEQLKKSNEELRSSEQRYHQMIAEVEDYAIIMLDEKGNIINWNIGASKIKGYSAEEIIGQNFRVFYLPEDREIKLPEKLIAVAIANGKAVHEGWRVRKDGSRFWGSIVITALHSENGSIIGFSKVTRDLTERKQSEDRINTYLTELESQNRELEQFAYVASHDLQEPLRKIQTFADLLEKRELNDGPARRYIGKITSSANRMSELIRSVLNYSRLGLSEGKQFVDVDTDTILKAVLEDFELTIQEKNARIASEHLPSIKAIPLQVNQLFTNLVGNALKFSDKQPLIKISTRVVDELPEAVASNTQKSKYLEFIFSDNGIGFEPRYEKQIFSLFQRLHAKHEYSGTGIGLALCKRIMENHGGFIKAEGEPGKGATFHLYFPYP
ncbi:MAG: sensor histidine kinase [Chitinophagaceae bacterium]